jgi:methylated-DNA-[protein]-cysteine S-methyltransferase
MDAQRHLPGTVAEAAPASQDGPDAAPLAAAARQLTEYFAGQRTEFDLPLEMAGTDFQRRVWAALREIPYGETVSYGELARGLGQASASRAVGLANGKNPFAVVVPCHRVVGSDGSLTGYGGGLDRKRFLLALEQRVSGKTLA